jgi:hypothetical protein
MRKSIAFSSKHLNHKHLAMRLFVKHNVEQRGFGQVRRELMEMDLSIEDSNLVMEEIKKFLI